MAWDYPTNFSDGTLEVTGIGSYFQYMQYATADWFSYGMLLVIWVMTFAVSALVSFNKALASASFITLIFAGYLLRIGIIGIAPVFTLLALLILGVLMSKSESASY